MFFTIEELVKQAHDNYNDNVAELMIATEIEMTGTTREEINSIMHRNLQVMKESVVNALTPSKSISGLTGGDALKMEPWQSFWKDIILLVALLILYFLYKNEFNNLEEKTNFKKYLSAFAFMTMVFVINWGITHEPVIDFRDYKIGTDLNVEKQKIAKNPSDFKTFYSLKNKNTGEILEVNQDDYVSDKKYWAEGSPWEIEEGKTTSKLTKQGYESEIAKFHPETADGVDLTEEILKAPKAILIFSYDPKNANINVLAQAEAKLSLQRDAYILGVSTSPTTFKTINNATMDGTAIKTIARSNPFVLTLKNGKIIDKRSAKDYL